MFGLIETLNSPLGWRWLRNRGRTRELASRLLAKLYHHRLQKFLTGDWKFPVSQNTLTGIAVSLTSWKPRLQALPLVLMGLLLQQPRPKRIFLWLTPEDTTSLDQILKERFEAEGVEFRSCENLGPHKKWLPLVREGWEEPFVICDDDIFYPADWLQNLIAEDRNDAYVGTRAHQMNLCADDLAGYECWSRDVAWSEEASEFYFLTGCGGAVIHPERIGPKYRDWTKIQAACPKADDIWLKAAHLDAGIPVYKTRFSFPCLEVPGTGDSALLGTNVDDGGNDKQLGILKELWVATRKRT